MLKMLNMALISCPVGFSEEIIAVFQMQKSQIDTENEKKPKDFMQISNILCIFVKVPTDFVDRKVLRGQRGNGWL